MGKMILITTDNEVKELEYPDGGLKSWKKLREHIEAGVSESEIRKSWEKGLNDFKTMRQKYLIYN